MDTQSLGKWTNIDDQQPQYSLNKSSFAHWTKPCGPIIARFATFDDHAINEPNATLEFYQIRAQHNLLLCVGHWISSPIASLMQDAMKMTSSQTTLFDQLHTNASYMKTLSCLIYKKNQRNCCYGVTLKLCIVWIWWWLVNLNF